MQIGYLKPLHDFWCLAYKLKELATHQKHVKAYWNNLQIFPLCKTLSKALELSEAVVQGCSVKKVFLKFTGKHLCQSLFFNEVAGRPETLLKKRLWHACNFIKKETLAEVFSCEFCEFFKNSFFTEHLWWLLLKYLRLML